MIEIDKARVLEALRLRITETLEGLVDSQNAAQAGSIHEETRAEDPKDMRSTEASYLARGLAQRVEELRFEVDRVSALALETFGPDDAVGISALVGLQDAAGNSSIVFIVAAGAGESLEVDGASIRPVTPASPLGRALTGSCAGDFIEVELPGGKQELSIRWIV